MKNMQQRQEQKEKAQRKANNLLNNQNESPKKLESIEKPPKEMKLVPDGYIRRVTSTIPFGYEIDENTPNYLKPIEEELDALSFAESMIVNEECSLQEACDWLEYKTGRKLSTPGLKKHIDKKYGPRDKRLGEKPSSLLAR
ncbi:hypothetical protein [Hyphomonas sp.]|uniref:hypothetical protein n=1 Tax=Hyphomonas sp. TaxID=87 RepID=UPI0025BBDB68|nr:hypothetical protein [Hyphomonas sp.]